MGAARTAAAARTAVLAAGRRGTGPAVAAVAGTADFPAADYPAWARTTARLARLACLALARRNRARRGRPDLGKRELRTGLAARRGRRRPPAGSGRPGTRVRLPRLDQVRPGRRSPPGQRRPLARGRRLAQAARAIPLKTFPRNDRRQRRARRHPAPCNRMPTRPPSLARPGLQLRVSGREADVIVITRGRHTCGRTPAAMSARWSRSCKSRIWR